MPKLHEINLTEEQLKRLVLLLEDDIQTNEDIELLNILNIPLKPLRILRINSVLLDFNNPVIITCPLQKYIQILEILFKDNNCLWSDNEEFTKEDSCWDYYKNNTCYCIDDRRISYGPESFYRNDIDYTGYPLYKIEELLI